MQCKIMSIYTIPEREKHVLSHYFSIETGLLLSPPYNQNRFGAASRNEHAIGFQEQKLCGSDLYNNVLLTFTLSTLRPDMENVFFIDLVNSRRQCVKCIDCKLFVHIWRRDREAYTMSYHCAKTILL